VSRNAYETDLMKNLQILFCASEVSPYAKTGGLADVTGALPAALQQLGCDVRVFLPLYRSVREQGHPLTPVAQDLSVPVGLRDYTVHLWESRTATGIPVYFLEKDEFYDREFLYGTPTRGDYEDNPERFIAFCRSVFLLCDRLKWYPSIFHLHDWQTALAAVYLDRVQRRDPNFARSGTLFTIHNLAYQGIFSAAQFGLTGLPPEVFSVQGMEFWGDCNFMKAGLLFSDILTTVSPGYSKEIQTPELGHGLEGVLLDRRDRLHGILNGIDTGAWNPETDPLIPCHYSVADLSGKLGCKKALIEELGLPEKSLRLPLLGMISRLAGQKGFDLLGKIMDDLMGLPLSMVILGTGDADIERGLKKFAALHPKKLRLLVDFDERLAHRIEAASDIFLMPSHYEPCGLNQMYSLRYGTVPLVHATGGLDDSVIDVIDHPDSGTGFKFHDYQASSLLDTVGAALEFHRNKAKWAAMQKLGMSQDFSWNRSAGEYLGLYRQIAAAR
jgi:starch synthase